MPDPRICRYNKKVGLIGLISATRAGCTNLSEVADHLDITEEYLHEALSAYQEAYAAGQSVDNYWILFEPKLQVYEVYDFESI